MVLPPFYSPILKKNPNLQFFAEVDPETGMIKDFNNRGAKVKPKQTAYFKGMKFQLMENSPAIISGSFHKYYNNGSHNYNDFSLTSFRGVINDFLKAFNILPHDAKINVLEIGINIQPTIKTTQILNSCFFHKKKPFKQINTKTQGHYIQAEHDKYIVKIYDKGLQYKHLNDSPRNNLRIEIKMRGNYLRPLGIVYLSDLTDASLKILSNILCKEFENILYYDHTINYKGRSKFHFSSQYEWNQLIVNRKDSLYKKQKKKLRDITSLNSNQTQKKIQKLMQNKLDHLFKRVS